ncbi:MAG: hypothetical protein KDB14_26205 [Planctomycetales bacterium]|nr:hypothetical protein [Planctomycetales bacterium]
MTHSRFHPGQLVATPGALKALGDNGSLPEQFLSRHVACDWGEVPAEDAQANELALVEGSRLLSAYALSDGRRIWIITEAEDGSGFRRATTILLPEEY